MQTCRVSIETKSQLQTRIMSTLKMASLKAADKKEKTSAEKHEERYAALKRIFMDVLVDIAYVVNNEETDDTELFVRCTDWAMGESSYQLVRTTLDKNAKGENEWMSKLGIQLSNGKQMLWFRGGRGNVD